MRPSHYGCKKIFKESAPAWTSVGQSLNVVGVPQSKRQAPFQMHAHQRRQLLRNAVVTAGAAVVQIICPDSLRAAESNVARVQLLSVLTFARQSSQSCSVAFAMALAASRSQSGFRLVKSRITFVR